MPTRARCLWISVAVLLVWIAASEGADGPIKTLLSDPARYDGQSVTLAGSVTQLEARVSKRGNSYYTFRLADGSSRVIVFSYGEPPCPAGSEVTVQGVFNRVKQVGNYTFYDQIDAKRVVCR
jgi:hypothetical protein